jgi:4-alpha-glucanotransferase
VWGIAAQLYLLRSEADWGIGGYGELEQLVDMAAGWGADVVGVNPLHAMTTLSRLALTRRRAGSF